MQKSIFDRNHHKRYLNNIITPQTHSNFLYKQSVELICDQLDMFTKVFQTGLFYGFGNINIANKCHKLSYANIVNDYRSKIIYDEDKVLLPHNCYDLIVSNLSLHFVNDIQNALKNYANALKPNGLFLAIIFGENTLTELRQATLNTDIKYYNCVFPKVIPMITTKDFSKLALAAGFAMPVSTLESINAVFKNFNSLLKIIRAAGQINSLNDKPRHFYGHKYFSYLQKEYCDNFSEQNGKIRATFDYIFLSASKNLS